MVLRGQENYYIYGVFELNNAPWPRKPLYLYILSSGCSVAKKTIIFRAYFESGTKKQYLFIVFLSQGQKQHYIYSVFELAKVPLTFFGGHNSEVDSVSRKNLRLPRLHSLVFSN